MLKIGVNSSITDEGSFTPLLSAVEDGYNYIAQLLVDNGANFDLANSDNITPYILLLKKSFKYSETIIR